MNRNIEFRIWADNQFYYKCLVGNTNDTTDNNWTCPMVWLEDKKEWVNCDNGIIQQYTGLKDKNGKKIFEGDILKNDEFTLAVIYNPRVQSFVLTDKNDWLNESTDRIYDCDDIEEKFINNFFEYNCGSYEIIGNIYENKEYMEGQIMKIIDLLNKIANNEQPKHIIFDTDDWYWGYDSYVPKSFLKMSPDVQVSSSLFVKYRIDYCLNDEVEIIEEDKKIEKITINENGTLGFPNGCWTARNMDRAFAIKINELIDEINELKEGRE